MLIVGGVAPDWSNASVVIDEYIPLSVRTYSSPMPTKLWRVGNFRKSLVDLKIDEFGLVRGVTGVSIDQVGNAPELGGVRNEDGLPIVDMSEFHGDRVDCVHEVRAALWDNNFALDWSDGAIFDSCIRCGRLRFMIADFRILTCVVVDLDDEELGKLEQHIARILRA